jgi:hypothetical protein
MSNEETPTINRDAEGRPMPGSKFRLEDNGIAVEIEFLSWQPLGAGLEPMVLLTLRAPDDAGIMSGVWHWSTDHFLSLIYSELQTNLKHPCPWPEEVWETFLGLVKREKLDQYIDKLGGTGNGEEKYRHYSIYERDLKEPSVEFIGAPVASDGQDGLYQDVHRLLHFTWGETVEEEREVETVIHCEFWICGTDLSDLRANAKDWVEQVCDGQPPPLLAADRLQDLPPDVREAIKEVE